MPSEKVVLEEAMLPAITAVLDSAGFTVRNDLIDNALFTLQVPTEPDGPPP